MGERYKSFQPLRYWAPDYWRCLFKKFYWRPLITGPPVAFCTTEFEDKSLIGKPWIYRISYDRRSFGDRVCLKVAPCDPAGIDLKRLYTLVKALWQLRRWQPNLVYRDVHVDTSDCVDGDLPDHVFRVAKRPGEPHPLLPNFHLLSDRKGVPKAKPWVKKAAICWFRGAATGDPDFLKNKRAVVCRLAKQMSEVDGKLTSVPSGSASFLEQCQMSGILSSPTNFTQMNNYRFLLDIDGNTTSWDRYLRIGLFRGVPIRFEPIWTEYWHDKLDEGENVVTVSRNTFADQLNILLMDEDRSKAIAHNAGFLARTELSRDAALRAFADSWSAFAR